MVSHGLKGGIGTASRIVRQPRRSYRVGALVQANYGKLSQLRIAGIPVGKELLNPNGSMDAKECGSIIGIIATDAPLLPHQCTRLARRAGMGLARMGAIAANSSGDLFLAFSTANAKSLRPGNQPMRLDALRNNHMDALFLATIEAIEEAIINALLAAKDMEGINGRRVNALSHDRLRSILQKYRHGQPRVFESK
jgi:D-aminopeptidase